MASFPLISPPIHPGVILVEEYLVPLNISQRELADALHVSYQRINELVNQRRGVTPNTALRLARFFGISAHFWLNLQMRWDLYQAEQIEDAELETIVDYRQVRELT